MSDRIDAYATAMLEVARAEGHLQRIEDEVHSVATAIEGSEELRSKLTDNTIPVELRQRIIEDLLSKKASPTTTALISFVIGAGRGKDLGAICNRFVDMAAAERNRAVAEVRSAMPLDATQREQLEAALRNRTGRDVTVKVIVDPTVLGGLITTIGDTVIDGSIRHRFDTLKETV